MCVYSIVYSIVYMYCIRVYIVSAYIKWTNTHTLEYTELIKQLCFIGVFFFAAIEKQKLYLHREKNMLLEYTRVHKIFVCEYKHKYTFWAYIHMYVVIIYSSAN